MNKSLFSSEHYKKYRPSYPLGNFDDALLLLKNVEALRSLDLGCGTGLSIQSLINDAKKMGRVSGKNLLISGVDIDTDMLKEAFSLGVDLKLSSATSTPYASNSFDFIFSGSAFHWFHGFSAFSEVNRLLVKGGVFFAFEYQFPKAICNGALNEFIKSNFNRNWKAPKQTPRGKFKNLFKEFENSVVFKKYSLSQIEMKASLSIDEFFGHLISQSRYLHFEQGLAQEHEKMSYREELKSRIADLYNNQKWLEFDFYFDRIMYKKVA